MFDFSCHKWASLCWWYWREKSYTNNNKTKDEKENKPEKSDTAEDDEKNFFWFKTELEKKDLTSWETVRKKAF